MRTGASTGRKRTWLLLFLALCTTAIFLAPMLLSSEYFWGSGTDIRSYQYPLRNFAFSWLRQGVWPLWNPYIFSGVPFQTGVHQLAYPGTLLGLVFSTGTEIKLTIWLHLCLALFFMALLLRAFRHSLIAAYLGGIVFALSGFFLAHLYAGHLDIVSSMAYAPLIVLAFDRALRYRGAAWTALAGMALALMLLSGHYQVIYLSLVGLGIFTVSRVLLGGRVAVAPLDLRRSFARGVREREPAPDDGPEPQLAEGGVPLGERLRDLFWWAMKFMAFGLVSGLLVLFQLLPLVEAMAYANRSVTRDYAFAVSFGVPKLNWLTYLVPDFFGGAGNTPFFAHWSAWEGQAYLGVAALLLVITAGVLLPRRQALLYGIVIALCTLLAMGEYTPFFKLWFCLDPLMGRFRAPGRFMLPATLFLAWGVALGLDVWLRQNFQGRLKPLLIACGVFTLALCGLWLALAQSDGGVNGWWFQFMQEVAPGMTRHLANQGGLARVLAYCRGQTALALMFSVLAAALLVIGAKLAPAPRRLLALGLVALTLVDLFVFSRPRLTTRAATAFELPAELTADLQARMGYQRMISAPRLHSLNAGAAYGLSHAGGYDTLVDARYNHAVNLAEGNPPECQLMLMMLFDYGPLCELQGVEYLISPVLLDGMPENQAKRFRDFARVGEVAGIWVYRNPHAMGRAFLVERAARLASQAQALERVSVNPELARDCVWYGADAPTEWQEALAPFTAAVEGSPLSALGTARIEALRPNDVEIRTDTARPAILVLSDAPFPGWRVNVDGRARPMFWANGGLHRAVVVPAGQHQVRFAYWPSTLSAGMAVSLSMWLLLALALAWQWWREVARSS